MRIVKENINDYLPSPSEDEILKKMKLQDEDPDEILEKSVENNFLPGIQYALNNGAELGHLLDFDISHVEDFNISLIDIVNEKLDTNFEKRIYRNMPTVYVVNVKNKGLPEHEEVEDILVDRGYDREKVSSYLEENLMNIFFTEMDFVTEDISSEFDDFVVTGRSGGWWGTEHKLDDFLSLDFDKMEEHILEKEELEESEKTGEFIDMLPFSLEKYIDIDEEGQDYLKGLYDTIMKTIKGYSNQVLWANIVEDSDSFQMEFEE